MTQACAKDDPDVVQKMWWDVGLRFERLVAPKQNFVTVPQQIFDSNFYGAF